MSSSIDYILEYTNESITQSGLPKISPQEFQRFIGTVLLSSTFSVSTDLSWSLMEALTNNSIMPRDWFNAILLFYESTLSYSKSPTSSFTYVAQYRLLRQQRLP